MKIETLPLDALNPAAYNPRKDLQPGDPAYEALKRSISEFGLVEPIIWNRRTGNIVGGHQRYKVLKAEGMSETDCVVVDLDDAHEKALNIALNKVSGEWDIPALSELLVELNATDFDLALTGFEAGELEHLLKTEDAESTPGKEIDPDEYGDQAFSCECPKCGFHYNVRK